MKNKRNSKRDDYRLLKNKLLIRTFGMLFFAFAFLATLYSLFLKGHIANTFVVFLDNFVYHDYDRALNVYSMYIRNYKSLFFIVLSLILFAIILRFYLNEFSKYFKEINRGIDALIEENIGDIDDLMLNTLGGILGYLVFYIFSKMFKDKKLWKKLNGMAL